MGYHSNLIAEAQESGFFPTEEGEDGYLVKTFDDQGCHARITIKEDGMILWRCWDDKLLTVGRSASIEGAHKSIERTLLERKARA
jgi:Bacterial protein of unknown function (DUF905)